MFDRKRLAPQLAKTFNFMEGGVGIFGFGYFFFLLSYQKTSVFPFWRLLRFAASPLFRPRFSVFCKNKIGFLDLLFDAVWCFSGFSSEIMRRF